MNTSVSTFSVTDLRHKTNKVIEEASRRGYAYLLRRSRIEGAIVDLSYFAALQEAYEDYLDILEFDEAIKEKGGISLADYKKRRINE